MDNPESLFHHTNIETLEKATTLNAPYYIPSSQTHLESADESHIFTPENRKEKKTKSKLEYQPINYSHAEESHNSEKLKDTKYSANSLGDNTHQTEASESEESNTIGDLRDLSKSLNGFDDSFANDTPISKRIARIHQRLSTDCHESFDLSLSLETDSENTSTFEFSSLESNNSDASENFSSDTSSLLSEKKSRMPQRSTHNVTTMLNRFRHGKPRPPTSGKERCKATLGSSSNDRNSSMEETTAKLQTEEIGKKTISHEHPSQSKALEERDLNRRMFDVEVDRLLQESAALSCGDVTSLPSSRVLRDPQGEKVVTEQSYDRDLHNYKNPAAGSSRQNDDILYQWRLKRKLERAHTRADQKSMQATEVMRNSVKTSSSKCLCDDSSPATTKQVAEKPYAHQQENLKPMESQSSNCYHHNPSACYCSHNNKHQVVPPPLIEAKEEEGAVIEVASTQTQTGDSLLLAKKKPTTAKSSNNRKSVKKRQSELAVQTDDDVPDSSNVSSQPDADDVSVDYSSSFVVGSASSSTNRRNRKGKGSKDPTVAVPSLTPTSKMMKKVVGNRLFEQTLDETKSQSTDLSSSRSLLTTSSRASNDQTSAFNSHENSAQISNRSKDCEDLTLDMILKRVEDDDGDFDDDEVLTTLRSKRCDLIEQLRNVENLLDKHYRSC